MRQCASPPRCSTGTPAALHYAFSKQRLCKSNDFFSFHRQCSPMACLWQQQRPCATAATLPKTITKQTTRKALLFSPPRAKKEISAGAAFAPRITSLPTVYASAQVATTPRCKLQQRFGASGNNCFSRSGNKGPQAATPRHGCCSPQGAAHPRHGRNSARISGASPC